MREGVGFGAGICYILDVDLLDAIDIVKKGKGTTVPNFSLVQVVGCLTEGPNRAWVLTRTSDPVVTKEEEPNAAGLKSAAVKSLGAQTFQLVSVSPFKPESHAGQKMEARGLLYRDPNEARLNLTSLKMVGSSCGN